MNSSQDGLPAFGGNLKDVLSRRRESALCCSQTLLTLICCTAALCLFQRSWRQILSHLRRVKASVKCYGISFNKKLIFHLLFCINIICPHAATCLHVLKLNQSKPQNLRELRGASSAADWREIYQSCCRSLCDVSVWSTLVTFTLSWAGFSSRVPADWLIKTNHTI